MRFLDQIPLSIVLVAALTLGLAPFFPEPHIVEKLRILMQGTLTKPIDMADLAMHAVPWFILAAKLVRMTVSR